MARLLALEAPALARRGGEGRRRTKCALPAQHPRLRGRWFDRIAGLSARMSFWTGVVLVGLVVLGRVAGLLRIHDHSDMRRTG